MAAQFIVTVKHAVKNGDKKSGKVPEGEKEKESDSEASGASGQADDPYGPYRPVPIGVLNIYGQKPLDIGHFDTVAKVLESLHGKRLPGGSNTIFASVAHLDEKQLDDVQLRALHRQLERLPDELTIIVHEGLRRA
jgi:hypothetical protein